MVETLERHLSAPQEQYESHPSRNWCSVADAMMMRMLFKALVDSYNLNTDS